MNVLLIYREERFSPSSVEKDRAILDAVAEQIKALGHEALCCGAETLSDEMLHRADVVLSMARGEEILGRLSPHQSYVQGKVTNLLSPEGGVGGGHVLNDPKGVRLCSRRYELDALLRQNGICVPPTDGPDGVWIKRGDGSAEVKDDIVLCHTSEEEHTAIERMKARGIDCWVRQAHMKGDLVKFYGVEGMFFHHSYPTDTGHSKFGLEAANGKAQHYAFCEADLRSEAERIASLTGVRIYGGDAIVTADGSFCIIDFNDWPSFSSCRDEAARAIGEKTLRPSPLPPPVRGRGSRPTPPAPSRQREGE